MVTRTLFFCRHVPSIITPFGNDQTRVEHRPKEVHSLLLVLASLQGKGIRFAEQITLEDLGNQPGIGETVETNTTNEAEEDAAVP